LTTKLLPRGTVQRTLAIILDGTIHSSPTVRGKVDSQAMITGDFSQSHAEQIVDVIRTGTMPCVLTFDKVVKEAAK
jgi:preprotein translocase subunit SecD